MERPSSWWLRAYRALQNWITPELRHSQYSYKKELEKAVCGRQVRWLDAGCGRGLFPAWMRASDAEFRAMGQRIVGIDLDMPSMITNQTISDRVVGTLGQTPFRAHSFDLITANMVVEHIADPPSFLSNVNALLAPGGTVIFHTANYLHYQTILVSFLPQRLKTWLAERLEHRKEEDVFPTHYRLNTERSIRKAAARAGLRVRLVHTVESIPETFRLGPFVIFELLLIRVARLGVCKAFRSNIVAILEKPGSDVPTTVRVAM